MRLSIEEIIGDFPEYQVAVVRLQGLKVTADRPAALQEFILHSQQEARALHGGKELADIAPIKAWRVAYRRFGIKQTKYRSSVERLLKNVLAGKDLPAINSFVDFYNAISLRQLMPAGADDLARVSGDLAFRPARQTGEHFLPLGRQEEDPPKPGEVVYADGEKVLCRRWNWYQTALSPISLETEEAVLTIQSLGLGEIEAAAEDFCRNLSLAGAGEANYRIAASSNPVVTLP